MDDAMPLSLTYESFARFWNALVSRRRARRLQIDRDAAWTQLRAGGDAAPFLIADAQRKSEKKVKPSGKRKSAGKTKAAKSQRKAPDAGAESAARKKPVVKRSARRPAARKSGRMANRKPPG